MNLIELHPYYLLSFLQDWISVYANILFKTALCSQSYGDVLFHILRLETSTLVLPTSLSCDYSIKLVVKSFFRNSEREIDVIFTRKVCPKLQWKIFSYYNKQEMLQQICCLNNEISLSQLLFPKVDTFKSFVMWAEPSSPNKYEIIRTKSNYECRIINGFCILYFEKSGDVYRGNMIDGMFCGHGKMTWGDGGFYEGEWKEDNYHGYGELHFDNGDVYCGEWKDDKMHGTGEMRYANGDYFIGDWVDDGINNGTMQLTYENRDRYIGEVMGGMRHGQGQFKWSNGNSYIGEWKDNKGHGKGEFKGVFCNGAPSIDW